MEGELHTVFASYPAKRRYLLQILQDIQQKEGYISDEALQEAAYYLGISTAEVYGVATFYNQFRFIPYGKHHIVVCLGTACHAMGGQLILDAFERELEITAGGITPDHEWSVDRVGCIGCCTKAPVAVLKGSIHAKMTPFKVEEALSGLGLVRDRRVDEDGAGAGESQ